MRKSKYISRIHLREKTLLTKRNLASYFSVHQDTIGRWMKWHYLVKPEDKLLYPESNVFLWKLYRVNKWLKENCLYGEIELIDEAEMIESLLSIKQASLLWNVSPAFLTKWYHYRGILPFFKIGFTIRLEKESLNRFMRERARCPIHRGSLRHGRIMRAEKHRAKMEEIDIRLRGFEKRIIEEGNDKI